MRGGAGDRQVGERRAAGAVRGLSRDPPSVPDPVARDAVTATPLCARSLPSGSLSCTTGCAPSATPLSAVADGWVVTARLELSPSVAMARNVTGEPDRPATSSGGLLAGLRPQHPLHGRPTVGAGLHRAGRDGAEPPASQ